jgi:hypothetical protein
MKLAVEIASDGRICVPSFTKIGLGIQVMLRLLPPQSEMLQYRERFMLYAIEMALDGIMHK